MIHRLLAYGLALLLLNLAVPSCSNVKHDPSYPTYDPPSPIPPSQEELREQLILQEQQNPIQYLECDGTWRKNLLVEAVLEGTISNKATLATFKDVVVKVTWLSKTDSKIDDREFTLYEFVGPGERKGYKIKTYAPTAADGHALDIISAVPTEGN